MKPRPFRSSPGVAKPQVPAPGADAGPQAKLGGRRREWPWARRGTHNAPMDILATLETRFALHPVRHPQVSWETVASRLATAAPSVLHTLAEMEASGGEPDVIGQDPATRAVIFCDCSKETPKGRRSLCYDQEALESRKDAPPAGSAIGEAARMGFEMLDEAAYFQLQSLGEFDLKTSTWLRTPPEVRALGGALFGDRRFGRVFIYHNGAQSYYAVRGFRGMVRV